jgi:hypothetical protein
VKQHTPDELLELFAPSSTDVLTFNTPEEYEQYLEREGKK